MLEDHLSTLYTFGLGLLESVNIFLTDVVGNILKLIVDTDKTSANYKRGERLKTFAGYATPTIAATIEWAGKVDEVKHPVFASYFGYVKEYSVFAYIFMISIFALGNYLTRKGNKVCWDALQVQIDELQSIAFSTHQNDANDQHRVTLFKYNKWCWKRHGWNLAAWYRSYSKGIKPWSGWLMPKIRSGHLTKNTRTVFAVPDEGKYAEGIGGKCWASDSAVHIENLPALKPTSSEQNKDKYSTKTNIPRELVDDYIGSGKILSRSLMAMPVKTSTGARWGVVVVDSQNATGIDVNATQQAFRTIIQTLGVLLEDIK